MYQLQIQTFAKVLRKGRGIEKWLGDGGFSKMSIDQKAGEWGKQTETVDCPICGPFPTSKFLSSNGFQIEQCRQCTLLYVNPRCNPQELAQHFREEYIADDERVQVEFVSYREASLAREAATIKELSPQGGRLLDVGTASGLFLTHFSKEANWKAEGVEPSSFAARYAREQFGLTIHEGFLNDQQFGDAIFDVVTSLDTFPLHPYPNEDLAEMGRILKMGGLLAIEIPGLTFRLLKNTGLISRLLYGEPVRLNAGIHLFYYSRETLVRLLSLHGFELVMVVPEQAPVYGSAFLRFLNGGFFTMSKMLAHLSFGKINVVPKEFCVFRKVRG